MIPGGFMPLHTSTDMRIVRKFAKANSACDLPLLLGGCCTITLIPSVRLHEYTHVHAKSYG